MLVFVEPKFSVMSDSSGDEKVQVVLKDLVEKAEQVVSKAKTNLKSAAKAAKAALGKLHSHKVHMALRKGFKRGKKRARSSSSSSSTPSQRCNKHADGGANESWETVY